MKKNFILSAFAIALAAGCATTNTSNTQNTNTKAKEASTSKDDLMAKLNKECMEYGTPGKAHAVLEPMIGKWTAECKFWMGSANEQPMVSIVDCETSWILNGHYIEEKVKGDFMGMPFEGRSLLGYDNLKNHYFSMWIDNMSTMWMTITGSASADGKTLTFIGKGPNPFANWVDQEVKQVVQIVDNNKRVIAAYMPGFDGKVFKHMEITYTRK